MSRVLTMLGRAYVNHMLVFTIGCVAGAVEAFIILTPYIVN